MADQPALNERPRYPRWRQVVLDTTDARGLAEFYRQLLGWGYRPGDEPTAPGASDPAGADWLVLRGPGDVGIAFQAVPDVAPATWPTGARPQQLHLDLTVPDLPALLHQRLRAELLGAVVLLDRTDDAQEPLFVFADPAGHPFCIYVDQDSVSPDFHDPLRLT